MLGFDNKDADVSCKRTAPCAPSTHFVFSLQKVSRNSLVSVIFLSYEKIEIRRG